MDQCFFVTGEERCNVVVQKHTIHQSISPPHEIMRSDGYPELYNLNMPTHWQQDHYHPSKYISIMKDYDMSYGGGCGRTTMKPKQYPAAPYQVHVVAPPQAQIEKVVYYQGNHHHQPTQSPPPPPLPVKKPAPGTAINSNEAVERYGGILIKEFSSNKLPAVKGLVY